MGTHPIFESDFDCLTECLEELSGCHFSGGHHQSHTLPGSHPNCTRIATARSMWAEKLRLMLNDLLLPLFLASDLLDDGQGRVKVQGTQAVANVVGVHCAITLEVIDGEGEFHPLNITSTEIRGHFVLASSTPRERGKRQT